MLRTGPTGNLTHQYEMLRDVTKRRQYLTTWDGNVLDWRHKCCCLTATTESKGHHHLGWDINHTKMAHCFGQSLPQGICGVALIGTYQSCVKKEKKKKRKLERGSSDPANTLLSALGLSLWNVGTLVGLSVDGIRKNVSDAVLRSHRKGSKKRRFRYYLTARQTLGWI